MTTPWYGEGLAFTCTRCGNCCTGAPGYVWVNDEEIAAIAKVRGDSVEEVTSMYTRVAHRGRTLREKTNGDCVFFEAGFGCSIYEVRPRQCRTWPFWESAVRTSETWAKVQEGCPGAGKGELVSAEEITRRLKVIKL